MELLSLQIKNLNSFKGTHKIDFEDYRLKTNLFLISGSTGSGKTTILDAIFFALYNKTPRITKQGGKDLISYGEKSGYSKITYSLRGSIYEHFNEIRMTGSGKFYIKKDNQIVAEKTTDSTKYFERLISLNFDQFHNTVILSQGKFDQFINSTGNEKQKIINGFLNFDVILKKIKDKTKEKNIDFKNKKEELEKNISTLEALINSDKTVDELKQEVLNYQNQMNSDKKDIQEIEQELEIKKEVLKKLNHFRSYTFELQNLENNYNFEIKTKELNLLENIKPLLEISDKLDSLEKEISNLNSNLKQQNSYLDSNKIKLEKLQKEIFKFESQKKELEKIYLNIPKISKFQNLFYSTQNLNKKIEELKNLLNSQNIELNNFREQFKSEITNIKSQFPELETFSQQDISAISKTGINSILASRFFSKCPVCGTKLNQEHSEEHNQNQEKEFKKAVEYFLSEQKKLKEIKRFGEEKKISISKITNEKEFLEQEINSRNSEKEEIFNQLKINLTEEEIFSNTDLISQEFKKIENEINNLNQIQNSIQNEIAISKTKIENLDEQLNLKNFSKNELDNQFSEQLKTLQINRSTLEKYKKFDISILPKMQENHNSKVHQREKLILLIQENKTDLEFDEVSKSYEKLEFQKNELNNQIYTSSNRIGELSQKIKYMEENYKKLQKDKSELKEITKESNIFGQLDKLLGSDFYNFIISHFLRNVLDIANQYLSEMTSGRYQLKLQIEEKEEINQKANNLLIIDNFQDGNVRDIKTLSGGESFITSLAMALGLSDLASETGTINFMFLDEGFGTLDSVSLDSVFSMLFKLKSVSRKIGIVSHISEVKEKIEHRIEVLKDSDGFSQIEIK